MVPELVRREKALSAYDNLQQGPSESFADFYSRYEACALVLNKDDESAVHELINKLNTRFYSRIQMDVTTKYANVSQVRSVCQKLEISFKHIDARKPKSSVGSVGLTSSSSSKPTRRGNGRTSKSSSSPSPTTSSSLPPRDADGKVPLPAKLVGIPKLTDDLRKQLEKEGRCFGCRETGHRSNDPQCVARQWREANKVANAQIQIAEAILEEDEEVAETMTAEDFEALETEDTVDYYDSSDPENYAS